MNSGVIVKTIQYFCAESKGSKSVRKYLLTLYAKYSSRHWGYCKEQNKVFPSRAYYNTSHNIDDGFKLT